jgi:hypothetical protein
MMFAAISNTEAVFVQIGMVVTFISCLLGFVWCIHFVGLVYSLWSDVTRLQKAVNQLTSGRDNSPMPEGIFVKESND